VIDLDGDGSMASVTVVPGLYELAYGRDLDGDGTLATAAIIGFPATQFPTWPHRPGLQATAGSIVTASYADADPSGVRLGTISVETTRPVITIISPADGSITSSLNPVIRVEVTDSDSGVIDDPEIVLEPLPDDIPERTGTDEAVAVADFWGNELPEGIAKAWRIVIGLTSGELTIRYHVTAEDKAGNKGRSEDLELTIVFAQGVTLTVNSTADVVDATPGDGDCDDGAGNCTLRAAIMESNAVAGADLIILPTGTYTLTLGSELVIEADLSLTGLGSGDTIIQAATSPDEATSRVFNISGGTVDISDVTIRNGTAGGTGGGISNSFSVLTLTDTVVRGNSVDGEGGGIYGHGILTVTNSTVSGNTAASGGGMSGLGRLTVTNSTVSGNTATNRGGGIFGVNVITAITNSTVSGNVAQDGGGISNDTGTVEIVSTIVAGNTALTGPGCSGPFTSLGYNIIGDVTDCNFTSSVGDLLGTGGSPIDPQLGSLQDNGGPTLTHALLPGSSAIDRVPVEDCIVTTDQRGVARPQGVACDIGAYEATHPLPIPSVARLGLVAMAVLVAVAMAWRLRRRTIPRQA